MVWMVFMSSPLLYFIFSCHLLADILLLFQNFIDPLGFSILSVEGRHQRQNIEKVKLDVMPSLEEMLTKKYINTLEQNVNQSLDENKYKEVKAAVVDAHDVKEEVDDELPSPCPSPCPQVLVLVLVRVRREHQMKTSLS